MADPDPRLPHERIFDPPSPKKKGCGCLVPALLLGIASLIGAAAGAWYLLRSPEPTAEVAGESALDKLRQAIDRLSAHFGVDARALGLKPLIKQLLGEVLN